MPTLYIGNKNYSSWSLRPWLALRWAGVRFDEVTIPLGGDGYGTATDARLLRVSPTGRVPVLHLDGAVVWDSLAIIEWAAEQPGANLWPADPVRRAHARALACEMHAGFAAVRRDLSMNLRRRVPSQPWPEDTRRDVARLHAVVEEAIGASGGPFLFGDRSAADAMYAPVAGRFRTYGLVVSPVMADWMQQVFLDPDFAAWERDAQAEPMTIPETDALYR